MDHIEKHTVTTEDGCLLSIYHYGPPRSLLPYKHPVLMVHGLSANHRHFDLDDRYSLARAVSTQGFDVYGVDLRGAGNSKLPEKIDEYQGIAQWSFSDYLERDLPVVIAYILEHSHGKAIHTVGHSMGGMLLYGLATQAPKEIKSIVTLGTPMLYDLELLSIEKKLLTMVVSLAPATNLTQSEGRVPIRSLLGMAGRLGSLSVKLADGLLMNASNCDPQVINELFQVGISDVSRRLLMELQQAMGKTQEQGPFVYEKNLQKIVSPVLAFVGCVDRLASPKAVEQAIAAMGSAYKHFVSLGKDTGYKADYGHMDLLIGRHAPEEIYPQIIDFLKDCERH